MLDLSPLDRNAVQRRNVNSTNDLYNIFDDFFNYDGFFGKSSKVGQFRMDLKDEENHYLLEAELPGFKKEDITLYYEAGRLLISARQSEEISEEKNNYLHRERRACSMQRAVYLKDVMPEDIDAILEDGLLRITVPKLQNIASKKQIEIK